MPVLPYQEGTAYTHMHVCVCREIERFLNKIGSSFFTILSLHQAHDVQFILAELRGVPLFASQISRYGFQKPVCNWVCSLFRTQHHTADVILPENIS